jgi:type IV pilus assembly protein PilM
MSGMQAQKNKVKKMTKNIVALEMGGHSMKIVYGDVRKGQLMIKDIIIESIPNGLYTDGEIKDIEWLSKNLKSLLKKHHIRSSKCFCTTDSGQIITRDVKVPSVNKENLQEIAKFEVEQFLPVDMENYSVQSIILEEMRTSSSPFAEMLVTAVPKRMIKQHEVFIDKAGLRPLVLDTQANTLGKLIENQDRINGKASFKNLTIAFIDFGYEKVRVSIFKHGKFRFQRLLNFGAKDIDQAIVEFTELSLDEAKVRKQEIHDISQYSIDESLESKIARAIQSVLDQWLDEITKIFRYYSSRTNNSEQIDQIYLYGGISKINGIETYIQNRFNLPTERVKEISSVTLNKNAQHELAEVLNALGVMYRR